MKGQREKNMQKTALFSSQINYFDIYALHIKPYTEFFPRIVSSSFTLLTARHCWNGGFVYRNSELTYTAMQNNPWWSKRSGVSPSSPTKPVGWVSINDVSITTSFSRACARYSDDALFAFTTFTLTHYCCPKNEWNSRTYAKKRGRFSEKRWTFSQKRWTFSRKAPSFLITPSHNPKNTVTIPNCSGCWPTCFFTLFSSPTGSFRPYFTPFSVKY